MATGDKLVTLDELKLVSDNRADKSTATQSTKGLMSASDKTKLDGIASGAQVNTITGIKGNAESNYRTGNVNLTSANIGAVGLDSVETCLFTGQEIPANGTMDISFATSYRSFLMLAMGINNYTHDFYEGFDGTREICIPWFLVTHTNEYARLRAPDSSWIAWFSSDTVLHVENRTSNIIKFRLSGFK